MTLGPSKVGSALQALHYASYYAYWRLSKNSTENPEVLGFKLSKITKMSSDNLFMRAWIFVEPYMYIFLIQLFRDSCRALEELHQTDHVCFKTSAVSINTSIDT